MVGSLNADLTVRTTRLPRPGETVTGSDLTIAPGGKGSNQAAAAALLGADAALVGHVGDDHYGAFLLDRAQAAGIDTSRVTTLDGTSTGTAVIAVDESGENSIIVSPGANARLTADDVTAAADAFGGAAVLCLCFEIAIDTVRAAAALASAAGLQVVLNPSPYAVVDRDLLGLTDLLVVNQHELAAMLTIPAAGPGDTDWSRVIGALTGRGPHHVVVTFGASGAVVLDLTADDREPVMVSSPAVHAVDTTGCGDAFLGSLAARIALGDEPVRASEYAVVVGAFAATRAGAQSSYPTAAELDEFQVAVGRSG